MVHIGFRFISSFFNFESKVKRICLLMQDKCSIIATYRLTAALLQVIDTSIGRNSLNAEELGLGTI